MPSFPQLSKLTSVLKRLREHPPSLGSGERRERVGEDRVGCAVREQSLLEKRAAGASFVRTVGMYGIAGSCRSTLHFCARVLTRARRLKLVECKQPVFNHLIQVASLERTLALKLNMKKKQKKTFDAAP